MTKKRAVHNKNAGIVWDLSPLFRSDEDPGIEVNLKQVEKKSYAFINTWKDRTDYLREPSVMQEALEAYERWKKSWGTDGEAGFYYWLRTQQDMNDTELRARFNRVEEFSRKIENDIQFFHLRIAKIPKARQKRFLAHEGLRKYRHFLARIFAESAYLLSEPEEKILNLKSATSYAHWTRMTASG